MKNLESKDLPFRTLEQFYQPKLKAKEAEGIKVFPKNQDDSKPGIFATSPVLPSILTYISGLNQAKQLPRRIHNRHQYFSVPKPCNRHRDRSISTFGRQLPEEGQEHQKQGERLRIQTIISNSTYRSTVGILSQKTAHQKLLNQEKNSFNSYKISKGEQKEKEMRFSFYNTIQKSDYFIKKFKEDSSLSERKTNKYQNMFKRNITATQILMLLDNSKQKLKYGF